MINFRSDDGLGAIQDETPLRIRTRLAVQGIFAAAPLVPMPPVVGPTQLCLDVSKWQGRVDFALARSRGVRAFWIKADQGVWTDALFEQHTKDAMDAGVDYGFYHYIDPAQTSVTPRAAARHLYDLVANTEFISIWPDAEKNGGLNIYSMLDYMLSFCDELYSLFGTGVKIENYTRMSWWNTYVNKSDYWRNSNIGLNAARYHLGLSSPWSDKNYLPRDWDFGINDFHLWQYSADGNGMGSYFGCESASVDLNLWNGDEAAFVAYYNLGEEEDSDIETRLQEVETAVDEHERKIVELTARLAALEQTPPEPPPVEPPIEPPSRQTVMLTVKPDKDGQSQKAPAFVSDAANAKGVPIITTNLYQKTNDPALVRATGAAWEVYADLPSVDGGAAWYEIAESIPHYGYESLYVRADKLG